MSIHSPKLKFRAEVNFDKASSNLGSTVSFKADSIDDLKSIVAAHGFRCPATVVIYENMKAFPEFDWREIERYRIDL